MQLTLNGRYDYAESIQSEHNVVSHIIFYTDWQRTVCDQNVRIIIWIPRLSPNLYVGLFGYSKLTLLCGIHHDRHQRNERLIEQMSPKRAFDVTVMTIAIRPIGGQSVYRAAEPNQLTLLQRLRTWTGATLNAPSLDCSVVLVQETFINLSQTV